MQIRVVHFETVDAPFEWMRLSRQSALEKKVQATSAQPGERVVKGMLPESSTNYMGMPNTLLETIKNDPGMKLSADQIADHRAVSVAQ